MNTRQLLSERKDEIAAEIDGIKSEWAVIDDQIDEIEQDIKELQRQRKALIKSKKRMQEFSLLSREIMQIDSVLKNAHTR